jgi:hypothetical protein
MAADRKFTISGPGAADFLASGGGEDLPGTSPSKGMSQTRGESTITDPRHLVPRLGPDTEAEPGERGSRSGTDAPQDQRSGSQTGTVGGGGVDAHNPDPVRATGEDDPTAHGTADKTQKKRTTKKY